MRFIFEKLTERKIAMWRPSTKHGGAMPKIAKGNMKSNAGRKSKGGRPEGSADTIQITCGFKQKPFPDGWFEKTKRMVDVAYKAWVIRRGFNLPRKPYGTIAGFGRS